MYFIIGVLSFLITHKFILHIIIVFSCVLVFFNAKENKLIVPANFNFLMLILFGFSYILFASYNNTFNITVVIYSILMYFIGVNLFYNKPNEKNIILITNFIIIGLVLHATLNYINNVNSINRNVMDIFSKTNLNATLQASFVIMFLSTFFINLQNENKLIKVFVILAFVLSLMFILLIGSRTSLLIFAVTSIYTLVSLILYKDKTRDGRRKKIKLLFSIILSIIAITYLYENNTFNIKYKIESSHLYYRITEEKLERSDQVRYDNQYLGIVSLVKHPFGTKEKIGTTGFAHNMWLDIGKDAGIICFAFLFAYSIASLKTLYDLNKNSKVGRLFKIFFNSLYLGAFLSFQVEPILEAIPLYFGFFVLINGMLDMYNFSINKKKEISI